jgi:hypothetical protein
MPLCSETPDDYIFPEYLTDQLFDHSSPYSSRVFDHLIYVRGSTCSNETGLMMTLAHELQHFVQHSEALTIWAVNSVIPQLPREVILDSNLQWRDIPTELEARIISKRVAVDLCGPEAVAAYVEGKFAEATAENDVNDWNFVRYLDARASLDIAAETRAMFLRFPELIPEIEKGLQMRKNAGDPDYLDVDLDAITRGPTTTLRAIAGK